MGTLYVVATPIGNLEDVTLRALRVLSEVPLIAAEDTRTTAKLLRRHHLATPRQAYGEHNERQALPRLLAHLQEQDLALVSEAGTPTLSDPGFRLVRAAAEAGHRVVPIPGPSAVLAALTASGLPTDRFLFAGFLPRRRAERRQALRELAAQPVALILFESPRRLRDCLADALELLGDRPVAVCRELTKLHEEILRLSLQAAVEHFREHGPRGEFTLVIGRPEAPAAGPGDEQVAEHLRTLLEQGLSARDAVRAVAELAGLSRNEVYGIYLEMTDAVS